MEKKYLIKSWNYHKERPILEIEIERETASSIWINGSRELKITQYRKYFDTFEDAKKYLINKTKSTILNANNSIERYKKSIQDFEKDLKRYTDLEQ
jgi:hypothetical protein